MRIHPRSTLLAVAALALGATAAFASYGSKPEPAPRAENGSNAQPADANGSSARQQADLWFRDAYKDVEKGSAELADGNAGSAQKKFKRALERSRRATELDSTYYQAWNLVGFTSRKLGDYPAAFAAYAVAIRLKPDFAQAREYLGEGLLETGDLAGARVQLAALVKIGDAGQVADLQAAITKYEAAHGAAAADSAGVHGGQ
jgi:tetratricopeptide (TPR) repeat protein